MGIEHEIASAGEFSNKRAKDIREAITKTLTASIKVADSLLSECYSLVFRDAQPIHRSADRRLGALFITKDDDGREWVRIGFVPDFQGPAFVTIWLQVGPRLDGLDFRVGGVPGRRLDLDAWNEDKREASEANLRATMARAFETVVEHHRTGDLAVQKALAMIRR